MKPLPQTHRSIWIKANDPRVITIIDQRHLPHARVAAELRTVEAIARAIRDMWVRGAPLIGITAAYGMYLAARESQDQADPKAYLAQCADQLLATRPTAVNLRWAVERMLVLLATLAPEVWPETAFAEANRMAEEDVEVCRMIGANGLPLLQKLHAQQPDRPVNVLTHCNAGALACVDWGTATSPIFQAHAQGIPVHVWVDETRPRNQGARLTAWELQQRGIPHTVITDNVGGHLMQHGQVDICLVGTDRTTATGDVANKIGTYLKALAAHDNGVPFYVALPSSTIDWSIQDGQAEIPIEQRDGAEVSHIWGWDDLTQQVRQVRLTPEGSAVANYAFDVTPGRLVTGLITERGICAASEEGLRGLFPDR